MRRILAGLVWVAVAGTAAAQTVDGTLSYQGQLRIAGVPANGSFDLEFRLFNQSDNGAQIGQTVVAADLVLSGGLLNRDLNFGLPSPFVASDQRWLEVRIRDGASTGAYTTLLPRSNVRETPYASKAISADLALVAGPDSVNATSIVNGSVGSAEINSQQVQVRVTGTCNSGQFMQGVSATGNVNCASDSDTGVNAVISGGGISGTIASRTLTLGSDASVQRRTAASPLNCAAGQYLQSIAADGAATCVPLPTVTPAWSLSGNSGNPPAAFLGTLDNQPLNMRANNTTVASLQSVTLTGPAGGATTNIRFGSSANTISPASVRGATISGGGVPAGDSDPSYTGERAHVVSDHYGTIAGGYGHQAGDFGADPLSAPFASVGGGESNTASAESSTVAGGADNTASGQRSVVAGGFANTAGEAYDTVGGGEANQALGNRSVVGGGGVNTASGPWSTVAGGNINSASGGHSMVPGGADNCAGGSYSLAAGRNAKVRPGTSSGLPRFGCQDVALSGDGLGDAGTFVWADNSTGDFVSTGDNQFLIRAAGGFGFNSNNPGTDFDVVGNRNGHAALISNEAAQAAGVTPDGLAIRLNNALPATSNNFLTFQDSGGASVGSVEGNGAGGVIFNTSGGDYAEYLPKADASAELPPGSVVGIRDGVVGLDILGAQQLAVVSTYPAVSGNDPGERLRATHALIAFIGQVDVRVTGKVAAGDFLVADGAGSARAVAIGELTADDFPLVVARAWSATTPGGPQTVRALVGLNPADAAQSAELTALRREMQAMRAQLDLLLRKVQLIP
jgi:hypothetical protein